MMLLVSNCLHMMMMMMMMIVLLIEQCGCYWECQRSPVFIFFTLSVAHVAGESCSLNLRGRLHILGHFADAFVQINLK